MDRMACKSLSACTKVDLYLYLLKNKQKLCGPHYKSTVLTILTSSISRYSSQKDKRAKPENPHLNIINLYLRIPPPFPKYFFALFALSSTLLLLPQGLCLSFF